MVVICIVLYLCTIAQKSHYYPRCIFFSFIMRRVFNVTCTFARTSRWIGCLRHNGSTSTSLPTSVSATPLPEVQSSSGEAAAVHSSSADPLNKEAPTVQRASSVTSPLTSVGPHHESDVHRVLDAYLEFFNDIRFRKGWALPPFCQEDVEGLLGEAADIVVRIRKYLDTFDSNPKLRKIDGEASKFMFSDKAKQYVEEVKSNSISPAETAVKKRNHFARSFVTEIVRATFKDAYGYVEGLSDDKLNKWMTEIYEYHNNPRTYALGQLRALDAKIAETKLNTEFGGEVPPALMITARDLCSPEQEAEWRALIDLLHQAGKQIDKIRALPRPSPS